MKPHSKSHWRVILEHGGTRVMWVACGTVIEASHAVGQILCLEERILFVDTEWTLRLVIVEKKKDDL